MWSNFIHRKSRDGSPRLLSSFLTSIMPASRCLPQHPYYVASLLLLVDSGLKEGVPVSNSPSRRKKKKKKAKAQTEYMPALVVFLKILKQDSNSTSRIPIQMTSVFISLMKVGSHNHPQWQGSCKVSCFSNGAHCCPRKLSLHSKYQRGGDFLGRHQARPNTLF